MPLRKQIIWAAVAVVGAECFGSGTNAGDSPRWERTNAAGSRQNVAIAVCLPREDEIVCVGVGCRKKGGTVSSK
jgi:hypothetical protein